MRHLGVLTLLLSLTGCAAATRSPTSLAALNAVQVQQASETLPEDWTVSGDAHAAALTKLLAWAQDREILVARTHLERAGVLGFVTHTRMIGWILLLEDRQPVDAQLFTLLHELAHIFAPDAIAEDAMAETFAELTAAQVCAKLGLNTWRQTAGYLKAYASPEVQDATVRKYGPDIDRVVGMLTKAAQ